MTKYTPLFIVLLIALVSCVKNSSSSKACDTPIQEIDSLTIVCDNLHSNLSVTPIIRYFVQYEMENGRWYSTKEGQQKFVDAFKNKMLNDIAFAKEVASTYQIREEDPDASGEVICSTDDDVDDDVIGNYDADDGSYGQIKCFSFNLDIPIIQPLHDGSYEIPVTYQIICPIPATAEIKYRPYIKNVDHVVESPKYPNVRSGKGLDLGSYIIAEKAEKQL